MSGRVGDNEGVTRERLSILLVWLAAIAGTVGVGLLATPERYVSWTSILMLLLVCLTCIVQLGMQESRGFISRMASSMVGALVILALGSIVLLLSGGGAAVGVNP